LLLFNLCRKCSHGKLSQSKHSDGGDDIEVSPSVRCRLASSPLMLMCDDPPEGCPYKLEHTLATQDVDPGFSDWMSGRGRIVEDETVL